LEVAQAPAERPGGGEPAGPSEPISDQIIRQISLQLHQQRGRSEVSIVLYPKKLGHVRAELVVEDGKVRAQFVAETATVKHLIDTEAGRLRVGLERQGLALEELSVLVADSFSGGQGGMRNRYSSLGGEVPHDPDAGIERTSLEEAVPLPRWVLSSDRVDILV